MATGCDSGFALLERPGWRPSKNLNPFSLREHLGHNKERENETRKDDTRGTSNSTLLTTSQAHS